MNNFKYRQKTDGIKIKKKGFNYYCEKCKEFYRWNKLKEQKFTNFEANFMVCPECGEMVSDLKRE